MKKVYVIAILAIITLCLAAPLKAYVIQMSRSTTGDIVRHRWKNGAFPLTWHMNPVQGANVTGTRTQAEVFATSFAAWQSITSASVSFTQGADTAPTVRPGDDNVNLVTTNTLPSDLSTGVLALTIGSVYSAAGFDPSLHQRRNTGWRCNKVVVRSFAARH